MGYSTCPSGQSSLTTCSRIYRSQTAHLGAHWRRVRRTLSKIVSSAVHQQAERLRKIIPARTMREYAARLDGPEYRWRDHNPWFKDSSLALKDWSGADGPCFLLIFGTTAFCVLHHKRDNQHTAQETITKIEHETLVVNLNAVTNVQTTSLRSM